MDRVLAGLALFGGDPAYLPANSPVVALSLGWSWPLHSRTQILSRGDCTLRAGPLGAISSPLGMGLLMAATAASLGVLQGGFSRVWWKGYLGPLTLEHGTPQLF
ncbi:MAG: hypothetical protein R2932_10490 [Caldilineaceae bacterium]